MGLEKFSHSEKKDFLVSSASLKDVRAFSRDVLLFSDILFFFT